MNDTNSLAHTSWNCKYHIVFAPKYRRKIFYGEKRRGVGEILRTLCNWKKIKIIEIIFFCNISDQAVYKKMKGKTKKHI